MTNKKSNDGRRKLLKSIAAGSGAVVAGKSLPESWSKPVIDSVMLPAHAATTDDTDTGGPEVTTTAAPCCLVAGDYCGRIEPTFGDIIISVTAEGAISMLIPSDSEPYDTANASVACTGGSFDVTTNIQPATIGGTVGCGGGPITGEYRIFGDTYTYTATTCTPT